MNPFLIGIAGPSGAGKTELARRLARRLPGSSAMISFDAYYRPLAHISFEERTQVNFDHPDALDWDLIRADVRGIAAGYAINEPVYLFDQHTRAPESRVVEPADFVIVEGLFALYDAAVRSLLDVRIYVDAADEICLERRLARDVVERGRTTDSVLCQYAATVRPMADQFVRPTRRYAGLVISGVAPIEESINAVLQLLPQAA